MIRRLIRIMQAAWMPLLVGNLLSALAATTTFAQMGGIDFDPGDPGTGGRNTIQGNVYFPSGRRLDRRVRVRLNTFRGGDLTTLTDDNGSFSFRRLAAGTYTVVIDGDKDYEPAMERVDITQPFSRRGSASGQIFTVQIQLRLREGATGKPGVLNAALANVPAAALQFYQKALESARAGDSKKAIELLQNAISIYPQFTEAFNELGLQYMHLGQLDNAAEALRSALKLDPDAFSPLLNYGIALVLMKQFKEAEPQLRHALAKNDTSALAHCYLGRALANLHKFDDAEKELLRAITLGADDVKEAHRYLGAIYNARGDTGRTIKELETYLQLVPAAKDADQIRQIIVQLKAEAASQKTKSN